MQPNKYCQFLTTIPRLYFQLFLEDRKGAVKTDQTAFCRKEFTHLQNEFSVNARFLYSS